MTQIVFVNGVEMVVDDDSEWAAPTLTLEKMTSNVRAVRDSKLASEVDVIAGNVLRWASLTTEQQQAWADYRQALLDVPQQEGFPHNVAWPTKPE